MIARFARPEVSLIFIILVTPIQVPLTDVRIYEKNLYDKFSVSLWELADDDWSFSDDFLFVDPNKFDEDTNKSPQGNTSGPVFSSRKIDSSESQDSMKDNQVQSAGDEDNNEPT